MAITCPKCGAQYDVTLFEFGRTVVCDCGQIVDASQPQLQSISPTTTKKPNADDWRIHKCTSPDEPYQLLQVDRIWAGYAICDLESPLWEKSSFYIAQHGGQRAMVVHVDLESFHALTAFGDSQGINSMWHRIPLPKRAWISLRAASEMEHCRQLYDIKTIQHMWRIHLTAASFRRPEIKHQVIAIGADRCLEVETLLQDQLESVYSPDQLERYVFFGVERGGRLLSVVGSQVTSARYRVAAVGNAFTLPECRGRGYYRSCLAAVIERLFSMGIEDIVANVVQDNLPSLSGALSMGFKKYCPYWEGIGVRR